MNFWNELGRAARISLVTCIAVIALLAAAAGSWLLRTDYQVLFADLAPQDAGAMVAELERIKVPYKLGEGGTSILVDREAVHKTRIKLMGKDLPLHGTVGFELFNTADFGMTEFAQKVNYQRALQGEIARTILSLSAVETVRVHLALPEDGLFKRANNKAKAAITVTMKRGQGLRAAQVSGIQRLVAASVPGIVAQDVTIVDQNGVALTKIAQGETDSETGAQRLDLKRDMETYLRAKADAVLERSFGAGQAMASVDVVLDLDQVRITTEDVVSAPNDGGKAGSQNGNPIPTGVVVRERETIRDNGAAVNARATEGSGSSQREVEYQVGRRVEQVVAAPGSVKRIHVAVVVRSAIDAAQLEQVRALVAAAVGATQERGDTVVVQALANAALANATAAVAAADGTQIETTLATLPDTHQAQRAALPFPDGLVVSLILALMLALVAGFAMARLFLHRAAAVPALTHEQRQAALAKVRGWMIDDAAAARAKSPQSQSDHS